jgi:hypothetical protein
VKFGCGILGAILGFGVSDMMGTIGGVHRIGGHATALHVRDKLGAYASTVGGA